MDEDERDLGHVIISYISYGPIIIMCTNELEYMHFNLAVGG